MVAIVALSGTLAYLPLRGEDCSFDQQRWAQGRTIGMPEARFDALEGEVKTLVGCSTLADRRKADVEKLLGKRNGSAERGWYFNVGVPDGLSDYPGLHVTFDREDRVRDARVPGYVEP